MWLWRQFLFFYILEKDMTLNFKVKVLEDNFTIAQRISYALVPEINKYLNKIYQSMASSISDIVVDSIISQPEYDSLMGGQLQGEFGIPDPSSRLSDIISTIKSGSNIVRKPTSIVNGKINAGIRFQMISSDFQDLISLGSASFTTEKGTKLNWLEWLLLEGDTIIISDYGFVAGPNPSSRTGLGIMKGYSGASWRVPPEFAGNVNNNWITRGINSAVPEIDQYLMKAMEV